MPVPYPELTFHHIREAEPGDRWRLLFHALWPGYRAWYLQDGDDARPDLATARAALERHLPELVPTWSRLVGLTGGAAAVAGEPPEVAVGGEGEPTAVGADVVGLG